MEADVGGMGSLALLQVQAGQTRPTASAEHGEELEPKVPKKRAETWGQEEIMALINLRRDMDKQFNTSKSNRHLWEIISGRMKDLGYDRNPTMCTDKWRNLLKEYKKAKHHDRRVACSKMACYDDLDALLGERARAPFRSPVKGPLGRIVTVKYRDAVRKFGIDAPSCAIKEAIQSAFALRTRRRAFWLEDENGIIRAISRDMPPLNYTLCVDEGISVKICCGGPAAEAPLTQVLIPTTTTTTTTTTEERTFFSNDDLREFLRHRGWSGLRHVGDSLKDIDSIDELVNGSTYERAA